MSENGERIWEFVDRDEIARSFEGTELTDSDLESAIGAIQNDRAQLVVNGIASELGSRVSNLRQRKEALESELELVGTDLDIVEDVIKVVYSSGKPEVYTELLDRNLWEFSRDDLLKEVQHKPPFTLWFDVMNIRPDQLRFSMREWQRSRQDKLRELYGSNLGLISRSSTAIQDNFSYNSNAKVKKLLGDGRISEVVSTGQKEDGSLAVGFRIDNPHSFFSEFLHFNNVGPKVCVALLCIADLQAEDYADEKANAKPFSLFD